MGRRSTPRADFPVEQMVTWQQIVDLWGWGEYQAIAKDAQHRVLRHYPPGGKWMSFAGEPKPLVTPPRAPQQVAVDDPRAPILPRAAPPQSPNRGLVRDVELGEHVGLPNPSGIRPRIEWLSAEGSCPRPASSEPPMARSSSAGRPPYSSRCTSSSKGDCKLMWWGRCSWARRSRVRYLSFAPNVPPAPPIVMNGEGATVTFEGHTIPVYIFRGRPVVIAGDLGRALGYADKGLVQSISTWPEFQRPGDFDVLKARICGHSRLRCVWLPERQPKVPRRSLVILTETGMDLACQKAQTEAGARLLSLLGRPCAPQLRRGESVTAGGREGATPSAPHPQRPRALCPGPPARGTLRSSTPRWLTGSTRLLAGSQRWRTGVGRSRLVSPVSRPIRRGSPEGSDPPMHALRPNGPGPGSLRRVHLRRRQLGGDRSATCGAATPGAATPRPAASPPRARTAACTRRCDASAPAVAWRRLRRRFPGLAHHRRRHPRRADQRPARRDQARRPGVDRGRRRCGQEHGDRGARRQSRRALGPARGRTAASAQLPRVLARCRPARSRSRPRMLDQRRRRPRLHTARPDPAPRRAPAALPLRGGARPRPTDGARDCFRFTGDVGTERPETARRAHRSPRPPRVAEGDDRRGEQPGNRLRRRRPGARRRRDRLRRTDRGRPPRVLRFTKRRWKPCESARARGAGKITPGSTPTSPVPPPTVAPVPAAAPAPDFSREFIALAAGWGVREIEGYKATLRAQQVPRDSIEGWLAAVREARGELEGDGDEPSDLPPDDPT